MRTVTIAFVIAAGLSTSALAGGSSGVGAIDWKSNQSASLLDSGITMLGWFFSLLDGPKVIGPAADSIAISNTAVDDGIAFAKAKSEIDEAIDFVLLLHGGIINSSGEMSSMQLSVVEWMKQNPYGIANAVIYNYVEEEMERRGVKNY